MNSSAAGMQRAMQLLERAQQAPAVVAFRLAATQQQQKQWQQVLAQLLGP
jgi:hypothetical protein